MYSEGGDRNPSNKDVRDAAAGQNNVPGLGERRKSIDVRQIYNSAQRPSLTPRTDDEHFTHPPNTSTTSRPKSVLGKRAPSPVRVDSKELLGHFVKKMLNSATVKQTGGGSPSTAFACCNSLQNMELLRSNNSAKQSSGSQERKISLEDKAKNRRESLERKQHGVHQERNETRERKISNERKEQHGVQERTATKERNISYERKQKLASGSQERKIFLENKTEDRRESIERKQQALLEMTENRERKISTHERKQKHGVQEWTETRERKQQQAFQERNETRRKVSQDKEEQQAFQERNETREVKISQEKEEQQESRNAESLVHKVDEEPILTLNEQRLQESQGVSLHF
jgi:hypothetical protein